MCVYGVHCTLYVIVCRGVYVCVYGYVYAHVGVCACVRGYLYAYVGICVCVRECMRLRVWWHVYAYVVMCVRMTIHRITSTLHLDLI